MITIRDEKGFTLMEMTIVLAMMIILSAMLVPSLNYFQERQGGESVSQMNTMVSQALIAYYGMTGGYPYPTTTSGDFTLDGSPENVKKAKDVLKKIYQVTGYRQLQQYSPDKMKMTVHVVNQYVVKIDFEKK